MFWFKLDKIGFPKKLPQQYGISTDGMDKEFIIFSLFAIEDVVDEGFFSIFAFRYF